MAICAPQLGLAQGWTAASSLLGQSATWGVENDHFWALGGAIMVVGLALALWLVLGESVLRWVRPARSVRRCPGGWRRLLVVPAREGCWYDLSRVPADAGGGVRCPECGRHVARKRQGKVRRRWGRALLGVPIVVVGYVVWVLPRVEQQGWVGAFPTTGLVVAMPVMHQALPRHADWHSADQRLVAIYEELARRINEGELWAWQVGLAVRLVPMGGKAWDFDSSAMSFDMRRRPELSGYRRDPCAAEIWRKFQIGELGRHHTRQLLRRTLEDPWLREALAHTRPSWPSHHPVLVDLSAASTVLGWRGEDAVVRVRIRGQSAQYSTRVRDAGLTWLQVDGAHGHTIEIEAQVRLGVPTGMESGGWIAWEGVVRRVSIGGDPSETLIPVRERKDEQLRAWLSDTQVAYLADGGIALTWLMASGHPSSERVDYSFAVQFEILHNGTVLARGAFVPELPSPPGGRTYFQVPLGAVRAEWVAPDRPRPEDGLSIRFTGDRELAWTDLDRDSFWDGQLTIPTTVYDHHREPDFGLGVPPRPRSTPP